MVSGEFREGERQTERERETDRQTDRERERDRERVAQFDWHRLADPISGGTRDSTEP